MICSVTWDDIYAIDWMLYSPIFKWCNIIPNAMVFGVGVFGRWLGLVGRVLFNEIRALIKEAPGARPPLPLQGFIAGGRTSGNQEVASPPTSSERSFLPCLLTQCWFMNSVFSLWDIICYHQSLLFSWNCSSFDRETPFKFASVSFWHFFFFQSSHNF